MHAHKCGKCGTIFYHSNEMRGNAAAHKCPACGESQWEQFAPENAKLPNYGPAPVMVKAVTAQDIMEKIYWGMMIVFVGCLIYRAVKDKSIFGAIEGVVPQ